MLNIKTDGIQNKKYIQEGKWSNNLSQYHHVLSVNKN